MSMTVTNIDLHDWKTEFLWVERSHAFISKALHAPGFIKFTIRSGPRELYEYFPTCVLIMLNGERRAIVEFARPDETFAVEIPTDLGACNVELRFECEQGLSPKAVGLGEDNRFLGALITPPRYEFAGSKISHESLPQAPWSPGLTKHFDLREEKAPEPIFIVGCYRSGTSIAAWALGQHPNIFPMEETNWLPTLCHGAVAAYNRANSAARPAPEVYDLSLSEFLQWQGGGIDKLHRTLSEDRWHKFMLSRANANDAAFDSQFQLMRSRYAPKQRWVDATPENTSVGMHLAMMFPRGKFLHALREPLGVIRSLMAFDAAGGQSRTFAQAAENWERMNQWAYELVCDLGPARALIVPFETLVSKPADVLLKIWQFLGEPDFHRSLETFTQKINSSNVAAVADDIDAGKVAQLEAIHRAMIDGVPFASVPWTLAPNLAHERNNHTADLVSQATA